MSDEGRAGLLLLAMLGSLGVLPVLLRGLRPSILLALHAVGMCVSFAAAVSALTGATTGLPLALAYAAMMGLVGLEHRRLERGDGRLRLAGAVLVVLGLLLALAAQLWPALGQPVAVVVAIAGAAWAVPAVAQLFRRSSLHASPAWAASDRAAATAVGLGAVALVLGATDRWTPGLWPVLLGAAGALMTSVRTAPHQPPTRREWLGIGLLGVASFLALSVVVGVRVGAIAAGQIAAVALGITALSRGLTDAVRALRRPLPPAGAGQGRLGAAERTTPVSAQAIGVLTPMVDDGAVRRPARPAVLSRVPARRILDAALDRARSRQVGVDDLDVAVEIRADDGDLDIEGDAGALAEALCAVLDNAIRLRAQHPGVAINILLRGGHRDVTVEVSDDLHRHLPAGTADALPAPQADHPFFAADRGPAGRTGLGLGLSRARVLLARQGGVLLTRQTAEGSCVQVTVPRRRERQLLALA